MTSIGPWQPDILGAPWIAAEIELPDIRGKRVHATLVSQAQWTGQREENVTVSGNASVSWNATASESGIGDLGRNGSGPAEVVVRPTVALLYLHGLNDYFFQTHMAEHFEGQGIAFFALDLHGFGRSTLDEENRNDALSLREYGNELAAATRYIKETCGYRELVIMAHSTGGLIASLWAHSKTGRETVDGLVLNSPWFDLNRPWFDRTVGTAFVGAVGEYVTDFVLNNDESNYVRMLHKDIAGNWDFDLSLKREVNAPVRTGFFRAIREAQARLADGLDLDCPVLVCTSDRTGKATDPLDVKRSSDVVLDVRQIIARSPALGSDVEVVQIAGGIHDLALSDERPRLEFFGIVDQWMRSRGFISPHVTR